MSWNYFNPSRNTSDQTTSDRFSLMFEIVSNLRRRLENTEHTINTLNNRIDTLETERNERNERNENATNNTGINNLFNFEAPRRISRHVPRTTRNNVVRTSGTSFLNTPYQWTTLSTNTNNTNTNTNNNRNDPLTPLVDNIFNEILVDTINIRRGLTMEQLNANTSIEVFTRNTNQEDENEEDIETCCICREPFENSSVIRKINICGHKFHLSCIDTWFQSQYTCPMCRVSVRIIIPTNNENENENENENGNDNGNENDNRNESYRV